MRVATLLLIMKGSGGSSAGTAPHSESLSYTSLAGWGSGLAQQSSLSLSLSLLLLLLLLLSTARTLHLEVARSVAGSSGFLDDLSRFGLAAVFATATGLDTQSKQTTACS